MSTTPSLTTGVEIRESGPLGEFLAIVVVDSWQQGESFKDQGGKASSVWQWHLAVRPVDFAVGGATNALHDWFRVPEDGGPLYAQSKTGVAIQAWRDLVGEARFGEGELIGKVLWFTREDKDFGVNRKSGQAMVAKDVILPVRVASPEDTARAQVQLNGQTPAGQAPATAFPGEEYSAEELEWLLEAMVDKAKRSLAFVAARSTTLTPPLKNALSSGAALETLEGLGLVVVDGSGVVRRA